MELRCQHRINAVIDGDVIEISCRSRLCGKRPGVVVIHRFSVTTGKLIETKRFRDPVNETAPEGAAPEMGTEEKNRRDGLAKGRNNGARDSVSIRHS
jgi:hypothetical protein